MGLLISVGLAAFGSPTANAAPSRVQPGAHRPPSIAIVKPAANAAVPAGHVVVAGTASPDVLSVVVSIDGGPVARARGTRGGRSGCCAHRAPPLRAAEASP
jgi:hypothetical protein